MAHGAATGRGTAVRGQGSGAVYYSTVALWCIVTAGKQGASFPDTGASAKRAGRSVTSLRGTCVFVNGVTQGVPGEPDGAEYVFPSEGGREAAGGRALAFTQLFV